MVFGVRVRDKAERRKAAAAGFDAQLLPQLPAQRRLRGFPLRDLPSRKLPIAGVRLAFAPLGDEDAPVLVRQDGAYGEKQTVRRREVEVILTVAASHQAGCPAIFS